MGFLVMFYARGFCFDLGFVKACDGGLRFWWWWISCRFYDGGGFWGGTIVREREREREREIDKKMSRNDKFEM